MQERISMRKIKEVLRLYYEAKLSKNQIARVTNIGRYTVQQYILRSSGAGLSWPVEITDEELENKLFSQKRGRSELRPEPNYNSLLQEIRKPNATLAVLLTITHS